MPKKTTKSESLLARLAGLEKENAALRARLVAAPATGEDGADIHRLISENAGDVIWLMDIASGRFIYVSPSVQKLRGYTAEEVMSQPWQSALTPETVASETANLARRLERFQAGDESLRVVTRQLNQPCREGAVVATEVVTTLITDKKGRPVQVLGVSRDLTQRQREDQALRQSEERYRDLVEHIHDLICTHDLEGRLLSVNQAAATILGYDPVETVRQGRNLREFLAPQFQAGFEDYLAAIKREGKAQGLMAMRTSKGETRILEYNNTLRTDGVTEPIVRGLARDITERMAAEQALKKSEERFVKAFKASPIRMSITTLDQGRFLEVNQTYCRETGFSREELIGRTSTELGVWVDPHLRERLVAEIKKEGSLHEKEIAFRAKDGRISHVLWSAELIELDGQPCMLNAVQDVTERRAAEQALKKSEEKFAKAFKASPLWMAITTFAEGRYLEVNDAFSKITGYSRQEAMGQRAKDLGLWVEPSQREPLLNKLRAQGSFHEEEVLFRRKDGSIMLALWSAELMDLDGQECIISAVQDVTERRAAEEALKKSEEKFAKAFLHSPVWVVISDLKDGTYLDVNEAFLQATGFSRQEVLGRTSQELGTWASPGDRRRMVEIIEQRGSVHNQEVVRCTKDRREIPTLYSGEKLDLEGRACLVSVSQDITELKQAQERFRALVENSPLGALLIAPDGRYLYVNPRFVEMFGYTLADVPDGREWLRNAFPDEQYRRRVAEAWIADFKAAKSGEVRVRTYPVACKDGSQKIILFRSVALADGRQLVTHEDITERKAAEDALKKSEEQYKFLAENMSDIIWTTDLNLQTTYVSPSIETALGFSPEERLRQPLEEILTPDSLRHSLELLAEELRRDKEGADPDRTMKVEVQYYRKDGSTVWMENAVKAIRNDQGEVRGLLGVSRDIEERKRAEEALRLSEDKFAKAFQHSPLWVLITTLDQGRFVEVNETFLKDTGFSREEVIGHTVAERSLRTDPRERADLVRLLRRDGSVRNLEVKRRVRSGEVRDMLLSAELLPMPGEEAMVAVLADITELKRAQQDKESLQAQLRQAQKLEAIGTLAGGIAHDFNNILAAMMGYTELALQDLPAQGKAGGHLQQVLQAGDRAKGLVRQILSFSRPEAQDKRPLRLTPVIQDTAKLLRATIPSTVEMRLELKAERDLVLADPVQMRQLIMNLCTNAAQAMEDGGGRLTVRLENRALPKQGDRPSELEAGDYLLLTVSDTGQGMTPEVAERIFEPFFTTKQMERGTGMGLAVVHGIVKGHQGAINFSSRPGRGTTFRVYLPLSPDAGATEEPPQEQGECKGSERILFLDDEPSLAEIGRRSLTKLGYRVTALTDSVQALELLRSRPDDFDLIITDFTMPGLTGLALAQQVLALRPQMPIIICTGFSQQLSEEKARAAGIRRVALKPLAGRQLARLVRQVLAEGE
ncbi:MAG: PAS domain S-box protein [Thermodesulfobacteriota bacterium]